MIDVLAVFFSYLSSVVGLRIKLESSKWDKDIRSYSRFIYEWEQLEGGVAHIVHKQIFAQATTIATTNRN